METVFDEQGSGDCWDGNKVENRPEGRQLAVRFERPVNRTRSFLYEKDD